MRIELIRGVRINGKEHLAGSVIDVDDVNAIILIHNNKAIKHNSISLSIDDEGQILVKPKNKRKIKA
jgi:hypothetical protein